jgi:hypothetical protein
MGFGEIIQCNKRVATGTAMGLIAIGLLLIVYQLFGDRRSMEPAQGWFSTDDGATLFKDDVSHVPPFDRDGHEAVGAVPYTADSGKHQWVQYLTKFDSKVAAPPAESAMLGVRSAPVGILLVKKPGATEWVPFMGRRSAEIVTPKTPAGMGTGKPEQVYP